MQAPTSNDCEEQRLEALYSYQILDTEAEQAFDDLAMMAAQLCDTPVGVVSIVDRDRQWSKACYGAPRGEADRADAFCACAVDGDETLVVNNAATSHRFRNNPMVVGEPHIRFYAGAPLVDSDGHALGTLCAIDVEPRQLSGEQRKGLEILARQVVNLLELRRSNRQLAELSARVSSGSR